MLKGLPNEFSQVILNLLSNARDVFMEKSTASPEVFIESRVEGSDAVIRVSDNAGGIPDATMKKLFTPYFTTKPGGTGIDLSMSRQILRSHFAGDIECRNTTTGAEFSVRVPIAK